MDKLLFRQMEAADWESVAAIYGQGIKTHQATFQQTIPSWADWDKAHLTTCRIVAIMDGQIVGWAALTPVSARPVYAGVAEVSVYIAEQFRGQKIGFHLLQQLIEASENNGIWTLQASIFPENTASLRIHEQLDFRQVGYRERMGKMNGQWRDTLLLERRSEKAGID